eukprot:TRINITY_DN2973_c0_g1_i1.p1 TRINITY_DN2973_c0_g1~~TRINITY_DN2973_c0_g1_i1.p1  ORF type:complete len:475 (-),score=127.32 TRINITY_DN2973_c0_g1_i1:53-1315(-)
MNFLLRREDLANVIRKVFRREVSENRIMHEVAEGFDLLPKLEALRKDMLDDPHSKEEDEDDDGDELDHAEDSESSELSESSVSHSDLERLVNELMESSVDSSDDDDEDDATSNVTSGCTFGSDDKEDEWIKKVLGDLKIPAEFDVSTPEYYLGQIKALIKEFPLESGHALPEHQHSQLVESVKALYQLQEESLPLGEAERSWVFIMLSRDPRTEITLLFRVLQDMKCQHTDFRDHQVALFLRSTLASKHVANAYNTFKALQWSSWNDRRVPFNHQEALAVLTLTSICFCQEGMLNLASGAFHLARRKRLELPESFRKYFVWSCLRSEDDHDDESRDNDRVSFVHRCLVDNSISIDSKFADEVTAADHDDILLHNRMVFLMKKFGENNNVGDEGDALLEMSENQTLKRLKRLQKKAGLSSS